MNFREQFVRPHTGDSKKYSVSAGTCYVTKLSRESKIYGKTMSKKLDRLIASLSRLPQNEEDRLRIARMIQALDNRYDLANKIAREPGLAEIIKQLIGRLLSAYGDLSCLKGKRILDIACGSNTSKAPSAIHINSPFGKRKIRNRKNDGYTAQFEPWFCRLLLELEARPVGVDIGDLQGEAFEHYYADLGRQGALNFLPDRSFDAIQDSRLFGSPEFTAQFPHQADRRNVAAEIRNQERRLLKEGGIVIHSDAESLTGSQQN